ncbi:MAG: hypothetical protein ACE5K7_07480, partial [Phycisphaerae bacterium]
MSYRRLGRSGLAGDALPADNSRHFAIFVRERVSVLVVSGPASGLAGNDAGYYVRAALAAAGPVVRCGAIDAEQLDAGQVDRVDAIVLCNVPAVDAVGASALRALTVRGGSAVIFVGPDVQAKAWNALLGPSGGGEAWLPARLAGPTGPAGEAGGVLQRVADDHDLFAGLYEGQGQYRSVLVYRYFRVEPWDDCPGRPIAWLADGRALLIEKQYPCRAAEAGGVLLCTTTADAGWTNLPTRPVFAPLLLRAVLWPARRHLACASYLEGSRVRLRLSGRGGPPLEVQIPPDARGRSATLRVQPARSGGVAEYVFDETFQPGAYHWRA